MRIREILTETPDQLFEQYQEPIRFAVEKFRSTRAAIYRGSKTFGKETLIFRDPTRFETPRVSRNTMNYYTLWIENSPKWNQFPRRSRSFICATEDAIARAYGANYKVMIPVRDCSIGICPREDFWNSFNQTLGHGSGPDDLNRLLYSTMLDQNIIQKANGHVDPSNDTYEKLIANLKKIDPSKIHKTYYMPDVEKTIKTKGVIPTLDQIYDPGENGFELTTWREFKTTGNHEVWYSAPSVCMNPIDFKMLVDDKHPTWKF